MSTVFISIPFDDDEVHAVRDDDGVWVVVKRLCENLGLDNEGQQQRLKRQPWSITALKKATGPDGKRYRMFCLHLSRLPMWLSTIEAGRVHTDRRETLKIMQLDLASRLITTYQPSPN